MITLAAVDLVLLHCNCEGGQLGEVKERRTLTSGFVHKVTPVALEGIPVTPLR